MAKILLHLENDRFIEIVNLNRVWVNNYNIYGKWALMYSDDRYQYNTIYYSSNKSLMFSLKEKLVKAYANGDYSVRL
ncbi:MAG: hypothetical protein IJE59_05100 [Clostridia bacterium]|nr:hypothetical protein [Clostridia bacterium]